MKKGPSELTFVFRDDSPVIYCDSLPEYRTVVIRLTEEQREAVSARMTSRSGKTTYFESISQIIPNWERKEVSS